MEMTSDREERRKQKEILKGLFSDYDAKRHDFFVEKYNKQNDKKSAEQYRKNRGIENSAFQNGVQKAQTEIQNKLDRVGVKLENIDPGAAQTEFNFGLKAAKKGEGRNPPSALGSEAKKYWLQGYDSVKKSQDRDRMDSEDWHEEQKLRKYRGLVRGR